MLNLKFDWFFLCISLAYSYLCRCYGKEVYDLASVSTSADEAAQSPLRLSVVARLSARGVLRRRAHALSAP